QEVISKIGFVCSDMWEPYLKLIRDPILKKSRWLLLKRRENLKDEEQFRLRDLLRYNLKTVHAYLSRKPSSSSATTTHLLGPPSPSTYVVPPNHGVPHRAYEIDRPRARTPPASRTDP